jgi:hypothetical protein
MSQKRRRHPNAGHRIPRADAANDFLRARGRQVLATLAHRLRRLPPGSGLQVRTAEVSVPPSDVALKWELAQVADGLMGVLQDVREISRGIYPAVLS